MILEEQSNESSLQSSFSQREVHDTKLHDAASNGSSHLGDEDKNGNYFTAKVSTPLLLENLLVQTSSVFQVKIFNPFSLFFFLKLFHTFP